MIMDIFQLLLLNPMVNLLIVLNNVLFDSFGLAIIAFTIIVRLVTFPLTRRQLHQTRAMQSLQPRVQELNKKYSDPKRRQEEMMRLYKEAGVNPIGCIVPMLIQFPILIALFYAIRQTLPESPEALEALNGRLYDWTYIQHAVPLEEFFLGVDLKLTPNDAPSYFHPAWLLVLLVGITTWAQTKTTVTTITDERARAQQQMMTWMMPLMFAFFALSFPSGVSLYWVVNSIIGIGFNIATYGLPVLKIEPLLKAPAPAPAPALTASSPNAAPKAQNQPARELRTANGPGRSKRQNRRRRNP